MEVIDTDNISKLKQKIKDLKKQNKKIIVLSQDETFNKKVLELKEVDILILRNLEKSPKFKKHIYSGLNESLCKLAAKNNIKIGISLQEIVRLPKKEKALALSRIIQNIKLCRRTQTKIIFMPKQSKQDVISFFLTLKASTSQARDAC